MPTGGALEAAGYASTVRFFREGAVVAIETLGLSLAARTCPVIRLRPAANVSHAT